MILRIGTRRSALALAQAAEIQARLSAVGIDAVAVPMSTAGDRGAVPDASPAGAKGLFTSEIVRALLRGEIDLAVHSAKDLPAQDEEGVVIAAVPERADPRDVLVTLNGELPEGARVGTSSLRRRAQLVRMRPDVRVVDIRGNVDTRLGKLAADVVDGLVLAAAGLSRLRISSRRLDLEPLPLEEMVPAPGQGALAVQARAGDGRTLEAVASLDHRPSRVALDAERSLMWRLGGGCALPLGAHATEVDGMVRLVAVAASLDGTRIARCDVKAGAAEEAAQEAARRMIDEGVEEILAEVGAGPAARVIPSAEARDRHPLSGKVVLVTRPERHSQELVDLLRAKGAEAIIAPAIEIVPTRSAALTRALKELASGRFEWLVLTSQNTVEALAGRIEPVDVRARVAAVGEGTAEAYLRWTGHSPQLVPRTFTTEALARAFPKGAGRLLCARADIAPEELEHALVAKGWTPVRVDAYRTRFPLSLPQDARRALRDGRVDAVTFTSASTVRGFVGALGAAKGVPRVVCIGPVTAREARARGLKVAAVAKPHTIEGLVSAVERALSAG